MSWIKHTGGMRPVSLNDYCRKGQIGWVNGHRLTPAETDDQADPDAMNEPDTTDFGPLEGRRSSSSKGFGAADDAGDVGASESTDAKKGARCRGCGAKVTLAQTTSATVMRCPKCPPRGEKS